MPRSTWILCLAAMTATASAQSRPPQADAEVLFREGKLLMARQKFAEACAAFERSQELDPNISTLLNHADCREKNAQLTTAWRLFSDAERQLRTGLDATSKQLHPVAAARAGNLEARLSKLSITVPPDRRIAGLEVLRDADLLDAGLWNGPQPVDGGTYQITARAPGHAEWSTTVIVKPEADHQTVTIPMLAPEAIPTPSSSAPAPIPAGATRTHAAATRIEARASKRTLVWPIVMGGAAIALGGTAFAFARWGDRIYADAQREPDDRTQETLWRSADCGAVPSLAWRRPLDTQVRRDPRDLRRDA
jgi:tetratricopeptide (TPR) repeat protein